MEEEKKNSVGVDHFSKLMFGERKISPEEDLSNSEREPRHSTGDDWLFGTRRPQEHESNKEKNYQEVVENFLQNVDYIEIMKNVDALMSSASELKPVLKKVKPLLESFMNKK